MYVILNCINCIWQCHDNKLIKTLKPTDNSTSIDQHTSCGIFHPNETTTDGKHVPVHFVLSIAYNISFCPYDKVCVLPQLMVARALVPLVRSVQLHGQGVVAHLFPFEVVDRTLVQDHQLARGRVDVQLDDAAVKF